MAKKKNECPAGIAPYRFERKFTPEQELQIVQEYIDGATINQLAAKWECHKTTISRIMDRSNALEQMEKRATRRTRIALLKIKLAAAESAEKLIELSEKQREDKDVYADIQILGQLLDRAGVRETAKEDHEITVRMADSIGIKMPPAEE